MFFTIMFSLKDQIKNDNCLLLPWLIINTSFTIFILTAAVILTNGFVYFCKNINTNLTTCRSLQFMIFKDFDNQYLFDYFISSIVSVWLLFVISNLVNVAIILRIVNVFQTIEYKEYNQELLMIKYARITKRHRMNKSYDIQLPLQH